MLRRVLTGIRLSSGYTPIDSFTYTNVSFNPAPGQTSIRNFEINSIGDKIVGVGVQPNNVSQYTMQIPYDLGTTISDNITLPLNFEPSAVLYNNDGRRLFVLNREDNIICEYNLPNNYNINGASLLRTRNLNNLVSGITSPRDCVFSPDGLKLFVLVSGVVYELITPIAYRIDLLVYNGVNFDHSNFFYSNSRFAQAIAFNDTGDQMFFADSNTNLIYQVSLQVPFSMANGNITNDNVSLDIDGQTTIIQGIKFNNNGTRLYTTGSISRRIFQYRI